MENKKTIIAIIVVIILIVALVGIAYFYNSFATKQVKLLTEEANKILQSNIATENIDFDIKTEKNYAVVEKAIKEYVSKLKNIYVEMNEMNSEINPNVIFSAQNMQDKNLDEIDTIINDYKEKSKESITEYEELISEEKITENITTRNITRRKEYYINLYNTVMLGDVMKSQYNSLNEKIKDEKGELYDKLNKIDKIKKFLEDNNSSWTIKEDKIQFTNLNRMAEYYNLLNQLTD